MNTKDYKSGTIGDRFSEYENNYRTYLYNEKYTIIRLDGRSFSKFTKNFAEPFDTKFMECMNNSAISVFKTFQNSFLAYTQSDEITLILNPTNLREQYPFGGRTDKLLSLASSAVTGEFIRQMFVTNLFDLSAINDIKLPEFDARYFQVDTLEEALNALIARQNDCYRNAISSIGQYHYSHKELENVTIDMLVKKLENDGHDISVYDSKCLLGRIIQKEQFITYSEEYNTNITRNKIAVKENTERIRKMFDNYFSN